MNVIANENYAFTQDDAYQMEDKELFVSNLFHLLMQTRNSSELKNMYLLDEDTIMVEYQGGSTTRVNIAMDSYTAIIKDVIRQAID